MPFPNQLALQHLLNHTLGLRDYAADLDRADFSIICLPVAKDRLVKLFEVEPLDFPPGTNYRYSNSRYYLLGLVIEKITGKSYEGNIRDPIFRPW